MSKFLRVDILFLKGTHSVNCKLAWKPKELLQEILELELSAVFLNIATALRILRQWLQVNALSMC
jgi:hypothetical protein